jgi:PKD repeat protein
MRKLYALLAGFVVTLLAATTYARPVTPDVANFTFTVNHETKNVVFTNTSVLGNEPGIRRAFWSFGDGTGTWTPPLQGTQHQYQHPGTYNVCLKIFRYRPNHRDSVLSAQVCKTITINVVCKADFIKLPLMPGNNPLRATFKALPWHNDNKKPVRICWSFGDGQDTCIQYPNTYIGPFTVNHRYANAGVYEVCVRIIYQGGCEARKCKEIRVGRPDSCRADFERIPVTNVYPLQVAFKALPWHNNNKKPQRICWRFGDGTDTCINYPANYNGLYGVRHRYSQPGIYEVCVKIDYYGGCEARKCKEIRVGRPDSCRADFVKLPVVPVNNPLLAVFKALPWHNNNKKPQRICWRFGDGEDTCINYPANYTGQYLVRHRYNHPGLYEVCVKIEYFGGCEARKCSSIQIGRPDSCRADFERLPVTSNNPLEAAFKALPWHNNNRKPSKICWRFGDGEDTCINYAENYNGIYGVRYRYNQPGLYEVCVKIEYYGGCEARKCRNIQIGRPDSCRADFERLPLTPASPLVVGFKALPWHNNNKKPQRICWRFGDGEDTCINYPENYTGQYVVTHRYQQPGEYEVCVKIDFYGGCDARKCRQVVVPPPPVHCSVRLFEITPSITSLVRGFLAVPHSNPPRRPVRICWYFGDGEDTCIVIDPQQPLPNFVIRHTYPGPGVYRACVRVRFEGGCVAEDCKEVIIRSNSNVCGGFMIDSLVGPRTFKFKGFSIHVPNDEVIGYRWTFGDGSTATGREVTHTYQHGGNYEVCLFIRTRLGCETKVCRTVRVPGNNQPALNLSPNPVINILHAAFFSTHTETVTIRILNNNGTQVRSYVRSATVGPNNWNFDVSNLLPGMYSFVLQSPNQLASAIFIKQ